MPTMFDPGFVVAVLAASRSLPKSLCRPKQDPVVTQHTCRLPEKRDGILPSTNVDRTLVVQDCFSFCDHLFLSNFSCDKCIIRPIPARCGTSSSERLNLGFPSGRSSAKIPNPNCASCSKF